jgi:hypothetical protein
MKKKPGEPVIRRKQPPDAPHVGARPETPRVKHLLPPPARVGDVVRWQEPTKAELGLLRRSLSEYRDKPLPPHLWQDLLYALWWAAWQIGRPWDYERVRYQRWSAVDEGRHKHKLTADKAYQYASEKLKDEPSCGGIDVMRRDYLAEQRENRSPQQPRQSPKKVRVKSQPR